MVLRNATVFACGTLAATTVDMETDYKKLMTSKLDVDLQEYIDNRVKYNPNAVFAAIDELKNRGRTFSDTEIETIKSDLDKQQEISKQRVADSSESAMKWDKNAVDDSDAPLLYSQKAIYSFSLFFGVLFGSILMTLNFRKTADKKGGLTALAFGVVYTAIQLWVLSFIPRNTGLTLATSLGGAFILNLYFWNKFIGKETTYRKRPIWTPLILGIALAALLFLVAINE